MSRFPQSFKTKQVQHDPANDKWGNCEQCCISYILQRPLDSVPYFAQQFKTDDKGWIDALADWVISQGYFALNLEVTDEDVLLHYKFPYLLSGPSPRYDCYHAVVGYAGGVIYDPFTGDGRPIDEPLLSTDKWYVTLFVKNF